MILCSVKEMNMTTFLDTKVFCFLSHQQRLEYTLFSSDGLEHPKKAVLGMTLNCI